MLCFKISKLKFISLATLGYQFRSFVKQFVWSRIINHFKFFVKTQQTLLGYIRIGWYFFGNGPY